MKIISDKCVYVQREDIANLEFLPISIPLSTYMKFFKNGTSIFNESNRYEFIKFEDENEIQFFKNLDCIVDYNSVKDLSVDELMKYGKHLAQENKDIMTNYENMSEDEKLNNCSLLIEHELLEYKIHCIAVILWIKFRIIHINMPLEIGNNNRVNCHETKGIKKFIKRVLK